MTPSQGEDDNAMQSPTGRKSRQTSVSSDGLGVKSPLGNATAIQSSHSNSPLDAAATTTATPQDKEGAKSDNTTVEKDESDAENVNHGAKPPSEAGSTDATTPTRSSVSQSTEAGTKQQPDNEAYKRGVEAAYKYHQEQLRKKQHQQQQKQQQQ